MNVISGYIRQKACGAIHRFRERWLDRFRATYTRFPAGSTKLGQIVGCNWPVVDPKATTGALLCHEFDLLGSGPVHVGYKTVCRGFLGYSYQPGGLHVPDRNGEWLRSHVSAPNFPAARSLWSELSADYTPIDWSRDFRSGYRWPGRLRSGLYAAAPRPGSDIKWPWELGRLQHLPRVALASLRSSGQSEPPERVASEFRNQVIDFAATNPPRGTVQWCCTMDVAIRVANLLVAFDLCRAAGINFDSRFQRIMLDLVWQHFRHIVSRLEWHVSLRNNHYFSNLIGLLFTLAYLPPFAPRRITAWGSNWPFTERRS